MRRSLRPVRDSRAFKTEQEAHVHAHALKARGFSVIVWRLREVKTGRRWEADLDSEITQALDLQFDEDREADMLKTQTHTDSNAYPLPRIKHTPTMRPHHNRRAAEITSLINAIKLELDRLHEMIEKREASVSYPTMEYWLTMIKDHVKHVF